MKHLLLLMTVLVTLLAACASTPQQAPAAKTSPVEAQTQTTPPLAKRIYYFQHRLLPKWTFNSKGEFYQDLKKGDLSQLKSAATEIVNEQFSDSIVVKNLLENNAVLLTFPVPEDTPNCYFVLIQKTNEDYVYKTYEKTIDFGDGTIGVVGSWTEDGKHHNFGTRRYLSAERFLADVLSPG